MLFASFNLEAQVQDSTIKVSDSLFTAQQPQVQTHVIRGSITNRKTGEPVSFATVSFPNTDIGEPADPDGRFIISFDTLPGDTLLFQALGFKPFYYRINRNKPAATLKITLEPTTAVLKEVVIHAGEDPAITLLKKIIARKPYNNPERFENYSYEAYNKVEVDVLNLTKKEFEKLPVPYLKHFSYIYNNMDSSGSVPFLPFYLTETISDYYYQSNPRKTKEYIKASQVKGVNNPEIRNSMTKYLGNMFLTINPYDNYIMFFNRKYISPLNNAGPSFYKYRIIDTVKTNGSRIIKVHFKPLRPGDNCFEGDFKVVDSFYALHHISADVPKEANINWVKDARFFKEYSKVNDSVWFCTKENLTAELLSTGELISLPALLTRKTNLYKHIVVNNDSITKTVYSKRFRVDVVVADTAMEPHEGFWDNARHEELNKNEHAIYYMIDSMQQDPVYRKMKNLFNFFARGGQRFGPLDLGQYWNLYSTNAIEGHRFRISPSTTPVFSKKLYLEGYFAYGTKDDRFKYQASALYLLHKQFPRSYLFASYKHDIDRTLNYYDRVSFDNVLSVAIRKKTIPEKFMFADDVRFEYLKEYASGFSHMITFLHKRYDPYAPLPDVAVFTNSDGLPATMVKQTEVNLLLRYAWKERWLNSNYYRVSLGSKYPIVEMRYSRGLKGILDGAYDYNKVQLTVSDNIKITPLGNLYLNVFTGKYFGALPYPLLEIHPGNETYYYNKYAFNMMNQYEFISDQYAGINIEHSIGGGIFKLVPFFVKRMKIRQFWTAKGVIGSLNTTNSALNLNKGFAFRTLAGNPYVEVGTGIENIFKLFRVDCTWRVTPKRLPTEPQSKYFSVLGSLKLSF
jgi:hypothetical protein